MTPEDTFGLPSMCEISGIELGRGAVCGRRKSPIGGTVLRSAALARGEPMLTLLRRPHLPLSGLANGLAVLPRTTSLAYFCRPRYWNYDNLGKAREQDPDTRPHLRGPSAGAESVRAPGDRDQPVDGGDGRRWVIRESA